MMATLYALAPFFASPPLATDATLRASATEALVRLRGALAETSTTLELIIPCSIDDDSIPLREAMTLAETYAKIADCVLSWPSPLHDSRGGFEDLVVMAARSDNVPDVPVDILSTPTACAAQILQIAPKSAETRMAALREIWRDRAVTSAAPLDGVVRHFVMSAQKDELELSSVRCGTTAAVRTVPGCFAAEIVGMDCRHATRAEMPFIAAALSQHKLLIFRDQNLSGDDQLRFTALFGEPDMAWDKRNRAAGEPRIQVISNQYGGGNYHYDRSRRLSTVRYWHADTSFLANPTRFTFVAIQEVPRRHGLTHFANTNLAYEALPESLKSAVQGLTVCHSFEYIFGPLLRIRNDRHVMNEPDAFHPLVWDTPSGRVLYLSELAQSHVVDIPPADSDRLITQLMEHSTQLPFRYTHAWRAGDFLLWDNLGIMHKGGFADPEFPRVLHRSTVTMADVHGSFRVGSSEDMA